VCVSVQFNLNLATLDAVKILSVLTSFPFLWVKLPLIGYTFNFLIRGYLLLRKKCWTGALDFWVTTLDAVKILSVLTSFPFLCVKLPLIGYTFNFLFEAITSKKEVLD